MKQTIYSILILSAFLLNACGGGGGGTTSFNPNESKIEMELNKVYALKAGQTITKKSTDAKVSLITKLSDNTTEAILRSGECWLE